MYIQHQNIIKKATSLRWEPGLLRYNASDYADGVDSSNDYFVTSERIPGGQHFYLRVKEGYKVAYIVFYDRDTRKIVVNRSAASSWKYAVYPNGEALNSYSPVVRDSLSGPTLSGRTFTFIPADWYVRICVCKDDVEGAAGEVTAGSTMTVADDFVDAFYLFDSVYTARDKTGRPSFYDTAMLIARQLNAINVHPRALVKRSASLTNVENSRQLGVPYIKVSAQRPGSMSHFYPSLETYLSLWSNRRSLLYTEWPYHNVSEYGIDWQTWSLGYSYGNMPYGMVCNCVPSTLFGMPEGLNESVWDNSKLMTKLYSSQEAMAAADAVKLRPMDVIYESGNHVMVVTGVFHIGGETFIEILESSKDCTLYVITPAQLKVMGDNRGRTFQFVRPKADFFRWAGHYTPQQTAGLATRIRERVPQYVPNEDICTFLGDKVTLASGDMLWLNVRQTNGSTNATFDAIRIYQLQDDSYSLLQTMAISQPVSAHRKQFADGDVVWDIDVSTLFADGTLTGLFMATAYNRGTHAESAPTYFEVLNLGTPTAWRIGLSYGGNTTYDLLTRLPDEALACDREIFVRALNASSERQAGNYATHAHYLHRSHEEGKYGMQLVSLRGSLASDSQCQMAVKGVYGYAFARRTVSSLTSLLSSASQLNATCLSITGSTVGKNGWTTYVRAISSSQRGKTYSILFNDILSHSSYNMVVAQYTAADAASISADNLIKAHVVHRLNDGTTEETRMVDVVIDNDCTFLAVSTPNDINDSPLLRDMVELPVSLVRAEDTGFDYYFGWVGNPTEKLMLEDMSPASLLAYARGYMVSYTPQLNVTVSAADVAERADRNLFFLMWRDENPPVAGRLNSGGLVTIWDSSSFEGSSGTDGDWNTYKDKQVTIGGIVYRVAGFYGDMGIGDTIQISF